APERGCVGGDGRARSRSCRRTRPVRAEPPGRGHEPREDRAAVRRAPDPAVPVPAALPDGGPGGATVGGERAMSGRDAPPASASAPTFLAAPLVSLDAIRPGSVVIGGAPHDSTHFSRFGARMGPRGIR